MLRVISVRRINRDNFIRCSIQNTVTSQCSILSVCQVENCNVGRMLALILLNTFDADINGYYK